MIQKFLNLFTQSLKGPLIFWGASMLGNIFNWLFNLFAGRTLLKEEFAILTVFLSFQYLITVPAIALSTTVSRFTAYYSEKKEQQKFFYFFRQYWWLSWGLSLGTFALFVLFRSQIGAFFGIDSNFLLLIFAPIFIPLFLVSFEKGALFGQFSFIWVSVLLVIEAITKFGFFAFSGQLTISPMTASVLALPVSIFAAWIVSLIITRSRHPLPTEEKISTKEDLKDSYKFLSNSFFASLGIVLIYSLDVLLVKHFFSNSDAGIYSTLSLLGKIIYFGAGSLIGLLVPFAAREQAKNSNNNNAFVLLFSIVSTIGMGVVLAYAFFPKLIVGLLLKDKGIVALPYLTNYALAMYFLVLSSCFATYNLAKKRYLQSNLIILAALVEGILIWFFHSSLSQVVSIVLMSMVGLFTTILITEFLIYSENPIKYNLLSFFDLFKNINISSRNSAKKRILIFNWRDIKHIRAGGAEVYIHEIAKRLVKRSYEVTLFTSNDQRSPKFEKIEGVNIVRRGGFVTVYLWGILYYLLRFKGKFDLVIDSENGIPFFTPLFVRKPVILVVHHVHQDVFFSSLIPPFSWIANFLEGFLMPNVYKKHAVVSVSSSTADELLNKIGLETETVISNGVNTDLYKGTKKSKTPLISYVGRLKRYKSIEVLLSAFNKILADFPKAKLIIAGDGDHKNELIIKSQKLGIANNVSFLGKVSEKEKIEVLGKSWVMVTPSYQEGWGITCLEANACHTPVIASNVPGLKDAVLDGESGYLFEYGDSNELYIKIKYLITDEHERFSLSKKARSWSENFSWDIQAKKFSNLIDDILDPQNQSKSLSDIFNPIWKSVKASNFYFFERKRS